MKAILPIAGSTFLYLKRMKIFLFLLIFGSFLLILNYFLARLSPQGELKIFNDISLATISLFSILLSILATSTLIAKDTENKFIYTIFSKPVSKLEYLLGKFLGVTLLLFVLILAMDILFTSALFVRNKMILLEHITAHGEEVGEHLLKSRESFFLNNSFTNTQISILLIFYKSLTISAITLLLSTISTSSLFTIITGTCTAIIGHFQWLAKSYWHYHPEEVTIFTKFLALILSTLFPDLSLFNITGSLTEDQSFTPSIVIHLSITCLGYIALYLFFAWFIFRSKEPA